jgi:hypothetical protein
LITRRRAILLAMLLAAQAQVRVQVQAQAQDTGWAGPFTLTLLARNLAAVPERRARFTEERRFAALNAPLYSQGSLLWRRPDLLEKRTDAPEPEVLRITGSRVEVIVPGRKPLAIDLASQPQLRIFAEAMRAPLAGDVAALESLFEVTLSGGPAAWRLRLLPRARQARDAVASLEIEGTLAEPRRVSVLLPNGDQQIMQIEPVP